MSLNSCNSCNNINNNCPAISYWSASLFPRFVDQGISISNNINDSVSYKNYLKKNAVSIEEKTQQYLKNNFYCPSK